MELIKNIPGADRMRADLPFHPCIHPGAHRKLARIHLPVAGKCNIICRFCARHSASCRNNLPGISSRVMRPHDALLHLRAQEKIWGKESIVGISGPGEPLFNPETFVTLKLIKKHFPSHPLCLCTNGLLLEEKVQELIELGLTVISMTINGIDPKVVQKMQPGIEKGQVSYIGEIAAARLVEAQMNGLKAATKKGMFVKVNTIVSEGINDRHLEVLAKEIAGAGAGIMNLVPVIPPNSESSLNPPNFRKIEKLRDKCEKYIPQFRHCRQCRSDACGIPGKKVAGECLL